MSTFQIDFGNDKKPIVGIDLGTTNSLVACIGPTGAPLTKNDLPPPNTGRWVIRRKAEVVAAVRGGLITLEEALERYSLTNDEFISWQRSIERHGMPGLRTTRLQQYR